MWQFTRLSLSLSLPIRSCSGAIPRLCKMNEDDIIRHRNGYSRFLSVTALVSKRFRPDKVDETFIDREYDRAKLQVQMNPGDDDVEPTQIIQKMERDQLRRIRAIQKARTARLFPQPKEKRMLTTDTMEQIRFLKQEQPDEWTISRLANSFNVNEDLIIKVLKSKFVPSEKRKQAQDLNVKINLGLLPAGTTTEIEEETDMIAGVSAPSTKLIGDGHPSENLLSSGDASYSSELVDHTTHKSNQLQKHITRKSPSTYNAQTQKSNKHFAHGHQKQEHKSSLKSFQNQKKQHSIQSKKQQRRHSKKYAENDDANYADEFGNYDENYDLGESGDDDDDNPPEYEDDTPLKVVQKGREFYDENGELLYRV